MGHTVTIGESGLRIISKEIEAGTEGADGGETNSIVSLGLDLLYSGTSKVEGIDSALTITRKSKTEVV